MRKVEVLQESFYNICIIDIYMYMNNDMFTSRKGFLASPGACRGATMWRSMFPIVDLKPVRHTDRLDHMTSNHASQVMN